MDSDQNRNRVRVRVIISGRVQGVFFRDSTRQKAQSLNLSGYVRNRRDGKVEAEFEGPAAAVRQIISWCHDGPPTARVDAVDVEWIEPQNDFSGFSITF